jgi:hypothetical protein
MAGNSLSSLNSSSESSISSSSNVSEQPVKKGFSLFSPSTWSSSVSGLFKSDTCEEKKDKTINAATKTIEKAKADYNVCASKRSTGAKPASSIFSFLGFGSTPAAAPKVGGRKKTQKKQKKTKKGKTNKRRTFGWF